MKTKAASWVAWGALALTVAGWTLAREAGA